MLVRGGTSSQPPDVQIHEGSFARLQSNMLEVYALCSSGVPTDVRHDIYSLVGDPSSFDCVFKKLGDRDALLLMIEEVKQLIPHVLCAMLSGNRSNGLWGQDFVFQHTVLLLGRRATEVSFTDEIGELRAISGHVLRATGIQIPEDDLDNLHSFKEVDGILVFVASPGFTGLLIC
ncbi:hypothetical protein Tco_0585980 [Tanacetum coccineum]